MSALSPGHFHYNKDRRMDISEDSKFFRIHITDSQRQETIRRLKRGEGKKVRPDKLMICSVLQGKSRRKGTCLG